MAAFKMVGGETKMHEALKSWLVVLCVLLPALLIGLGERPLYKIQEVRVAETAREMLASGDWLVPRYNGELRLQKPPLPYWLSAAGYQLGGVNLWAARLPSALFGLLGAWLLFAWCRRHLDLATAVNTALVLVTSFIGWRYFRSAEADAPLLFFIAAACLCGYRLLQGDAPRRVVLAFFAALGLGFATKGPAALAIPLFTLLAAAWAERRPAVLRQLYSPAGILLLLVLAGGWYAWLMWQLPEAAQSFVGRQVDETFVSGNHAKPFWWYLAHAFDFFAPWSLLLIPGGIWLARHRPLPPAVRYALVWLAVVFVLLLATVNKQMQYALLLAPPLAVLLGYYAARLQPGRRWRTAALVLLGIALLALPVAGLLQHPDDWAMAPLWPLLALAPVALARWLKLGSMRPLALLSAGLAAALFLYLERYDAQERKTEVQELMAAAAAHAPLYQLAPGDGAVSYYAGRVVPPLKPEQLTAQARRHGGIWVVTGKDQSLPFGQRVLTSGSTALWRVTPEP